MRHLVQGWFCFAFGFDWVFVFVFFPYIISYFPFFCFIFLHRVQYRINFTKTALYEIFISLKRPQTPLLQNIERAV